jgi:hypothetical protein
VHLNQANCKFVCHVEHRNTVTRPQNLTQIRRGR